MKTATLIKRTPTLIPLAVLSYACYSVHASLAAPTGELSNLAKGLDIMVEDVLHAGAEDVRGLKDVLFRDPFRSGPNPDDAANTAKADPSGDPDMDHLAEVVKCLTLDATFVQGPNQIAIISGREYQRGQHLIMEDGAAKSYSQLYVASVRAHTVTLGSHGKTYELLYSDSLGKRPGPDDAGTHTPTAAEMDEIDPAHELAFFKRLLNSPLGKLGQSVTGNTGPGGPSNQPATPSRSRRSRGGRRSASGNGQ